MIGRDNCFLRTLLLIIHGISSQNLSKGYYSKWVRDDVCTGMASDFKSGWSSFYFYGTRLHTQTGVLCYNSERYKCRIFSFSVSEGWCARSYFLLPAEPTTNQSAMRISTDLHPSPNRMHGIGNTAGSNFARLADISVGVGKRFEKCLLLENHESLNFIHLIFCWWNTWTDRKPPQPRVRKISSSSRPLWRHRINAQTDNNVMG